MEDASDGPGDGGDSIVAFLKDNFEAIAVAVIMALVIKHFCVEAFKIPTSSMAPTLRGESENGVDRGDRILVDKFAYLVTDPKRWDVIVFRYPLNQARNFIKRIAGLPGERLRISEDGDLWVRPAGEDGGPADLRIPQKPRAVREQFYRAVYPPSPKARESDEARAADLAQLWHAGEASPNGWRVESAGRFEFAGGAAAELRTARQIGDNSSPDLWARRTSPGQVVRDARFRARIVPAGPAAAGDGTGSAGDGSTPAAPSRLSFSWRADDEFLAVLSLSSEAGQSRAFVRRFHKTVAESPLDVVLEPGVARDIELEYVDGALRAHVDGKELAVLQDGRRFNDTNSSSSEQGFSIRAEGGPLTVENLRIDRDLRYVNDWGGHPTAGREGVRIPDDSYFMLGDNTTNSSDSRKWRMAQVHFLDGSTILYEEDEARYMDEDEAPDDGDWRTVVDADGIRRRWDEKTVDTSKGRNGVEEFPAPFVRRNLIVGRAFIVFWPCWPDFPWRLGFIH